MASAEYSVLTPERVSVEYGIAGIGSRGAAAVIDTAIQFVVLLVYLLGLAGLSELIDNSLDLFGGDVLAGLLIGLFFFGLFAISSGYYILFEIIWSGQTPGKRIVGLRVLRESGYPLRPVDAAIRNVVRILDWIPIGCGLGVLVMLLNNRSKRLGDFAAGTIVVREGPLRTFPTVKVSVANEVPVSVQLSAADATLVRDFLLRRASMHPAARVDLARRLATALSQRYSLPTNSADPEGFLERLTP